jgi:hypothetical protein
VGLEKGQSTILVVSGRHDASGWKGGLAMNDVVPNPDQRLQTPGQPTREVYATPIVDQTQENRAGMIYTD